MKPKLGTRYPIWSAKTIILLFTLTIALSFGLVFIIGHKSVFAELQLTLLLIALGLFTFLAVGLYKGVRLKNQPVINGPWKPVKDLNVWDVPFHIDLLDFSEGIAGFIISIILWIAISIVLVFALLLLANVVWVVLFILGIVIYWVFYRALRQVFIKSRVCKGNLLRSIGYSLFYTLAYTGWIFALVWAVKVIKSYNT